MRSEVWTGGGRAWAGGSARAACTERGPGREGWGGYRACAERTENMPLMSVTLDVLRLSGWLNADAEQNMRLMVVTLDVSRLSGWLNADAEGNIQLMSVTLDVSRLSGWLNADAP